MKIYATDGRELYHSNAPTLCAAVEEAVRQGLSLRGANLCGGNFADAYLCNGDFRGANFAGADFRDADLSDANCAGADFTGADFTGATLTDTILTGAKLADAIFTGANLRNTILADTDLAAADLAPIREDFITEVRKLPAEIPALRQALVEGRIDGSRYTGKCACLAGTLARAHGDAPELLRQGYRIGALVRVDATSPRERWFLAIRPGHTPDNSQVAAITLGWIDEAMEAAHRAGS